MSLWEMGVLLQKIKILRLLLAAVSFSFSTVGHQSILNVFDVKNLSQSTGKAALTSHRGEQRDE